MMSNSLRASFFGLLAFCSLHALTVQAASSFCEKTSIGAKRSDHHLTPEHINFLCQHQVDAKLAAELDKKFDTPKMAEIFNVVAQESDDWGMKHCLVHKQLCSFLVSQGFNRIQRGISRSVFEHNDHPACIFKFISNSFLNRYGTSHRIKCAHELRAFAERSKDVLSKPVFIPKKHAYCIPVHGARLSPEALLYPEHIVVVADRVDVSKAAGIRSEPCEKTLHYLINGSPYCSDTHLGNAYDLPDCVALVDIEPLRMSHEEIVYEPIVQQATHRQEEHKEKAVVATPTA